MTPLQSWTILILLLAFVASAVWLLAALDRRHIADDNLAESDSASDAAAQPDEQLAPVIELRPRRERHLTLVPGLRPTGSDEFYDWQAHGL